MTEEHSTAFEMSADYPDDQPWFQAAVRQFKAVEELLDATQDDNDALGRAIDDLLVEHAFRTMVTRSYVYILRAGDYVKIGRSVSPKERIATLSIQLPFAVEVENLIPCEYPVAAERRLHELYAEYRANGEWFRMPKAEFSQSLLYTATAIPRDPRTGTEAMIYGVISGEIE